MQGPGNSIYNECRVQGDLSECRVRGDQYSEWRPDIVNAGDSHGETRYSECRAL
ncbi:unnamed protein product, partial [Staurois parvus]